MCGHSIFRDPGSHRRRHGEHRQKRSGPDGQSSPDSQEGPDLGHDRLGAIEAIRGLPLSEQSDEHDRSQPLSDHRRPGCAGDTHAGTEDEQRIEHQIEPADTQRHRQGGASVLVPPIHPMSGTHHQHRRGGQGSDHDVGHCFRLDQARCPQGAHHRPGQEQEQCCHGYAGQDRQHAGGDRGPTCCSPIPRSHRARHLAGGAVLQEVEDEEGHAEECRRDTESRQRFGSETSHESGIDQAEQRISHQRSERRNRECGNRTVMARPKPHGVSHLNVEVSRVAGGSIGRRRLVRVSAPIDHRAFPAPRFASIAQFASELDVPHRDAAPLALRI